MSPPDPAANADTVVIDRRSRVIGVDVARGLALIGMIATHVFATAADDGGPTFVGSLASGRAATIFVFIAGVSLAFLSGGRRGVRGGERVAASAGLVVRALLIGVIGLTVGYLGEINDIDGILPFYAVLFVLAIPLLGCTPMLLLGIAAAVTVLGPVLLLATTGAGLPTPEADPTFTTLFQDPGGLLAQLFLTGSYPVVIYLGYLCAGLAIGRLDLRSPRLAWLLLGVGAGVAVAARLVSLLLLYPAGGLSRLMEQEDLGSRDVAELLWDPDTSSSWWYLALPGPHAHTPIDMLHTLGSAAAVLGAVLLLTRIPGVARVLSPLAAAGSMSLTIYTAHLLLLATGIQNGPPLLVFVFLVVGALVPAWLWRRRFGQGPLEMVVARPATAVRRGVARRMPQPPPGPDHATTRIGTTGRAAQFLVPLAVACLLALCFAAGSQLVSQDAGNSVPGSSATQDGDEDADEDGDDDRDGGADDEDGEDADDDSDEG